MPLTQAEKKKRKQEKKAQKMKEAEELKIKTKKDELSRELEMSRAMVAAHMKQWYQRTYEYMFPQIKQDMEVAWHSFEHSLDLKDFIIDELQENMEEAKMQTAMSWQDYALRVDRIIEEFDKKLMEMDSKFQDDLKGLMDGAYTFFVRQENHQSNIEDYYKTILFTMEQDASEDMITAQGEYVTKRDEEGKRGVHAIEVLSAGLEHSVSTTVAAIAHTLQEYRESTHSRKKKLEELRAKDDYYTDMITRQENRMAKLYEEVASLQNEVGERHEAQQNLHDLRIDREETYSEYTAARAKLTRDTALDQDRLLTLTTCSNHVLHDLQRILIKGEKILRLGKLCRRLETQEEKVRPFGVPFQIECHEDLHEDMYNPLALFLRKIANVNLIKRKLEPTRDALLEENVRLRQQLETALEILEVTRG